MKDSYIFSGFGRACGKFKITNSDVAEAVDKRFLQGFSKDKILQSAKYAAYRSEHAEAEPFDYFAGHVMGFCERYHVTPFPPTAKKLYYAETSLNLCVRAVRQAIEDAHLQGRNIDAWFVSTVSPHEQAPGLAATVKAFFVPPDNETVTVSLSSGCAGFNMNLERAIDYLKNHAEARHIVVAHAETMSSFLTQRTKFVPFVTFGDAAAAVVVSKIETNNQCGILSINNHQDLKMLDYVGVDRKRNLYMTDSVIKDRAIENLYASATECLSDCDWQVADVDMMIPHQTGNLIVNAAVAKLHLPAERVFLQPQLHYGNISGASIPMGLAMAAEQHLLFEGQKILSATAGVGGNFGAFAYVHHQPDKPREYYFHKGDLAGKKILVLGASGYLGTAVAQALANRGAQLWLHANRNRSALSQFVDSQVVTCDFTDERSVDEFLSSLRANGVEFDYLCNLSGSTDDRTCFDVNFYAPVRIINALLPQIKLGILCVGTAAEDCNLPGFDAWTAANRAFHGYLATAGYEFAKAGLHVIYVQTGWLTGGLATTIPEKQLFKFMLSSGQKRKTPVDKLANNLANSLYLRKVDGFTYSYENTIMVARTGYRIEVDI